MQFYVNGRRVRERTGLTDKAAAQRLLTTRLFQADRNEYVRREIKPVRVGDLHQMFRARMGADTPRRWLHIKPVFEYMIAAQVATADISAYTTARQQEGAANATINRELACLRRLFRLGYRATPPVVRAVPYIPFLKEQNTRTGFVEPEPFERLWALAAAQPWLQALLAVYYTYGWRLQEVLDMRCQQVDWRANVIRLDPGTTKNDEGREVTMTARVRRALAVMAEGKGPDDALFTRTCKNGEKRRVRSFRKAWRKLCRAAGVPATTLIHDLRRSAARNLRRRGVAEGVIMKIGGWKTRAMFDRYNIISQDDIREGLARLEENGPYFGPYPDEKPPASASPKVQ
jgi:integrase